MTFRVRIVTSEHQFAVEPNEPILSAALRQGLVLPYGCRSGYCGACRARVVAGEVGSIGRADSALSEAEKAQGAVLLCSATALSDLEIEVREIRTAGDLPVKKLRVKIATIDQLAHDVMRLRLKLPEGQRLQFLAGQYVDVIMPDGRRRSFSLANSPHDDAFLELHIRNVPGGLFATQVFGGLSEKALLRIEGPFGQFRLQEDSQRIPLLVAGGTGFAPIKAMVEHAFATTMTRPLHLYWGVRARRDLYLPDLPLEWSKRHPRLHYVPVLSEPQADDRWDGRVGYVHQAVLEDFSDLTGFDVYAAGPPVMVKAARDAFVMRGLPPDQFFSDPFEPAPV